MEADFYTDAEGNVMGEVLKDAEVKQGEVK
jgi:hypothetical protein